MLLEIKKPSIPYDMRAKTTIFGLTKTQYSMTNLQQFPKDLREHPEFYNLEFSFPGEVWVIIPHYENRYMLSNWGRIKSLERIGNLGPKHIINGRILRQQRGTRGILIKERIVP